MFRRLFRLKLLAPILALTAPCYAMFDHRTINSPRELSVEDIKKQNLICFQKTGVKQTDELVFEILEEFVLKYKSLISEDFQIVVIEPESKETSAVQPELMIFRAEDYGALSLNKYIKIKNYSKLFKRLNKELNYAEQVGSDNLPQVMESTNQRNTEQLFICPETFTKEALKKTKKHLKSFMDHNQYIGRQVRAFVIRDEQTKKSLLMDGAKANKVYILAPKNNNLIDKKSHRFYKIADKQYTLVSTEPKLDVEHRSVLEQFVFPPFLKKSHYNTLILKVTMNRNQDHEATLQKVYDELGKLTDYSKVLSFKHDQDQKAQYSITVQRNNFDQIVSIYEPNCKYSKQQKIQLLQQSHTWKYTGSLDANQIRQWLEQIQEGKVEQYYKSEMPEDKRQISKRIVGEEYLSTVSKEDQTVVFHYSKNCFSCKKFSQAYETIAGQAQKWEKPLYFFRIDNDENKIEGITNYNSTPVFILYKKWNNKPVPFIYKHSFFTTTLFRDFITITRSAKLVDPAKVQQAVKRFKESQELIKECL